MTNTLYNAAAPISAAEQAPLPPCSVAKKWIQTYAESKPLTPKKIREVKALYEQLCKEFNAASGNLEVERMVECWRLHFEVQSISKIIPTGDFQVLEEKVLHFTIWRVFQRTYPYKINEALSLWYLQQKLFQRPRPIRTNVTPITPDEVLKIFKAAFIYALNSANIDEAFKLWQQQQKFIIDAHTLPEKTDYINVLDMHGAFSATLENDREPYQIVRTYRLWATFNKEFPLSLSISMANHIGAYKQKYCAAKEQLRLPLSLDCTAEPSPASRVPSLSHSEPSWVDSSKNQRILHWIDETLKTSQRSAR